MSKFSMKIARAAILACFVGVATLATPGFAAAATASTIESVTPTGAPSVGAFTSGEYTPVQLSSDGRYVAFMSYDGTLDGANPTATVPAAYVRDRATGHSALASVDGNGAAVGTVTGIELSGNGRTLAFKVTNDPTVYLRDLAAGTTRAVGSAWAGSYFSLDDDGGILVTGDANSNVVHVYDTSTASQITQFPGFAPLISGDGTHVAYFDVAPAPQQIVELDLMSGERRVVGIGSHPSDFISVFPGSLAISRDGRYLVFASYPNLVATGAASSCNAPGNSCPRLYRADTLTGLFQRVDVVSGGGDPVFAPFGGVNQSVGISADGQVAYFSSPGDFGLGSPPYQLLYAHDFASGRTVLASPPTPNGDTFINPSYPAPSQDGRLVAFLGQARTPAGVLQLPQVYASVPDFEPLSDSTPPSVLASVSPAPNGAGWNTSLVTVSFSCSDADSGVASCPSPVVVGGEGTNQLVSGTAADNAGNHATASVTVSIDLTDPAVTCPATPHIALGVTGGTLTASAADELSGPVLSSVTVPVSAATAGTQTVAVPGADVAGRTTTVSCAYEVDYVLAGGGVFGGPLNAPPTVNVAKAGQTIPIQWTLRDAAGNSISAAGSFTSVTSGSTACDPSAPTDTVEQYSGGSGLQYLGNGVWQYNWKTPSTYAGQCRVVRLNLASGQPGPYAFVQFK